MNGILLIDKPSDWTSNDVVQKLRGILRERRIGHAGTLDPLATGLLTVFVGRATRAVEFAEGNDKRYLAGLRPGLTTDTQDITGTPLRREDAAGITTEQLEKVLEQFRGPLMQTPPMYSAVKINGQRLYRLARSGKSVERPARAIEIRDLTLVKREGTDWILDVRCSKGTYIRTLCHDIGERLGCGACMSSLRRLEAGVFSVDNAYTMDMVAQAAAENLADTLLLPVDTLFSKYPKKIISGGSEKRVRNGNSFRMPEESGIFRLYSESGEFLAVGRTDAGECRIIKSFFEV